ncbi:MAG: hypothetical protein AAF602_33245, partial [Myxococcota bacterium]
VFFAEPWSRSQRAVESGEPILVTGEVELNGDEVKFRARSAETLTDVRARMTREVRFILDLTDLHGDRLDQFRELLQSQRGACRSMLVVRSEGRFEAELQLPDLPVEPSPNLEQCVQALFGRLDVVALS